MKVLIFIPSSRTIPVSLESIMRLSSGEHEIVYHFERTGDLPGKDKLWENVTRKYQTGRQLALDGGYDAMFCVEDDQIVPANALLALDALQTDIAYGLCVTRRDPHLWSATIVCGPDDNDYVSYDMRPDAMREAWNRVIPVIGCGLYCTLIRRPVLEAIPFEMRGTRCCDFYFAYDAHKAGYEQLCDTRVLCGHVTEFGMVVWPDGEWRYRVEEAVTA